MVVKVVPLFFAVNLLILSQFLCMNNNNNNESVDYYEIATQLAPECEKIIKKCPETKAVIEQFVAKMNLKCMEDPTCQQGKDKNLCNDCKRHVQDMAKQLNRIATTYHQRVLTTRIHIISFVVFVVLAVFIPLYPELQLAGNGGLLVLIAGSALCQLAASRQVVSVRQLISVLVAYLIYARVFYVRSDEYAALLHDQAEYEEFYRRCCQGGHLALD